MSKAAVLDSSAILAHLQLEPGAQQVQLLLGQGCVTSAVNLAEVYGKSVKRGRDVVLMSQGWRQYGLTVFPFSEEDALWVGQWLSVTEAVGLSLGDRACLALGCRLGLPVVTADRAWSKLKLPCKVKVLR